MNRKEKKYKTYEGLMMDLQRLNQLEKYIPSFEFVRCFNDEAKGYSHKFEYDISRDMFFFSALTERVGTIQIYAKTPEEMEREFIREVRIRLSAQYHTIRPGWMRDNGWGE